MRMCCVYDRGQPDTVSSAVRCGLASGMLAFSQAVCQLCLTPTSALGRVLGLQPLQECSVCLPANIGMCPSPCACRRCTVLVYVWCWMWCTITRLPAGPTARTVSWTRLYQGITTEDKKMGRCVTVHAVSYWMAKAESMASECTSSVIHQHSTSCHAASRSHRTGVCTSLAPALALPQQGTAHLQVFRTVSGLSAHLQQWRWCRQQPAATQLM